MSPRERYIRTRAAQLGLDPEAVVAIGSVEGPAALRGGVSVGDNGTSFGPFQLHVGGALPAGKDSAWAHSAAGIDYALRQMAGVARGLRGQAAVSAISSRFERPADVPGEISKAMGYYGHGGAGGGGGSAAAPTMPSAAGNGSAPSPLQGLTADAVRSMTAAYLLHSSANAVAGVMPDPSGLVALAIARRQQQAAQQTYGPQPAQGGLLGPVRGAAAGGGVSHISPVSPNFKFGRIDQGVDVSQNHPYVSPGSGTVTRIGSVAGGTNLGVYVKLDHPITTNGRTYPGIYVWHTSPLVRPGQRVSAGQPIMSAGSAEVGFATADGRPVAPLVGGLGAGTQPTSSGHDMLAFFNSFQR